MNTSSKDTEDPIDHRKQAAAWSAEPIVEELRALGVAARPFVDFRGYQTDSVVVENPDFLLGLLRAPGGI